MYLSLDTPSRAVFSVRTHGGALTNTYICNSYDMAARDLPDIYALARGLQARGRRHIYQANHERPCYK